MNFHLKSLISSFISTDDHCRIFGKFGFARKSYYFRKRFVCCWLIENKISLLKSNNWRMIWKKSILVKNVFRIVVFKLSYLNVTTMLDKRYWQNVQIPFNLCSYVNFALPPYPQFNVDIRATWCSHHHNIISTLNWGWMGGFQLDFKSFSEN